MSMPFPFDIYPWLRPLLFRLDAERAHELAIAFLKYGIAPKLKTVSNTVLHTRLLGLDFPNPIGLAAGFDKQAEAIQGVLDLGFGFVELGTVVPLPQIGNTKPRLFRIVETEAVLNRFGFNSDGIEVVLERIKTFFETTQKPHAPVGLNVGKNKDSTALAEDYVTGIKAFAPYADYLTVNISSPNTPGLRDLQRRAPLADLLKQVMEARVTCSRQPQILVKIAPDQTDEQLQDIAEVALELGIHGIIVGNTTLSRPPSIPARYIQEAGGISGLPLRALSTQILAKTYQLTQGKIPLVGCGGIASGADAYEKIRAGASLVQVYSALVYHGPHLVSRIANDLSSLLERDGFASVKDAVGIDSKNLKGKN